MWVDVQGSGDTGKSLVVDTAAGQWTASGTATYAGETFNVYNHNTSLAQLILDQQLTVSGGIVL